MFLLLGFIQKYLTLKIVKLMLVGLEDSTYPTRFGQTGTLFQSKSNTAHDLFSSESVSTIRISDPFPDDRTGLCELIFFFC